MPKDKPVHEVRMGAVKAAIWKNSTQNGFRYNTTLTRLYRDGDAWKSTDSLGRDDLFTAAKVLEKAAYWIFEQGQAQQEEEHKPQGSK